MNEKLLRTCKRLNRFTLEELEVITETDKSLLKPVLEELISQRQLVLRDGIYFYCNEKSTQRALLKLPLLFQYHSQENIELILRAFCADITSTKTELVIGVAGDTVYKFNHFFRKILYERQHQELLEHYKKCPQISCGRTFCETKMYFYTYKNQVYVAPKLLGKNAENYTDKISMHEFKKVYSFITRDKELHKFANYLEHRIAELIWQRNKPFEQLLSELKFLIS
ncbi:MAG: hypothetical protein LBK53_09195 [Heliobacteriaceae bacterium]|nr:hypothetical protein [Heliobacteriaceae bacterium]